jgi:hypothetical protein
MPCVQGASFSVEQERQRKLEINDRIDPEFGTGNDNRICMGNDCERTAGKHPVAFAIVKEGVPCLWVGGFQIFAPSFAETLLSAVLSEFIFRILAKFQLAGPESGSV